MADSSNAIGPDFDSGNGTQPAVYVPLSSGLSKFPVPFVLVPVLALLLAAFAAACGPAPRATRISPSIAVRAD